MTFLIPMLWQCSRDLNKCLGLCYWASVRCDTGPQVSALLGNGSSDGWSLHFTFVVHDHACIVLEVDEDTVSSAEGFALPNDDGRHDLKRSWWVRVRETFNLLMVLTYLLSQLWFTLLDGSDEHIADSGSWQTVQTTSDAVNGNDVQVLTAWNSIKPKASMSIHNIQFAKLSRHSPVLSAQFMTAPTGQASEMRNLPPADPPRPETTRKNSLVSLSNKKIFCFFFLGSEKLNLAKFRNFSLYRRKFQRNSMRHGLIDVDDTISHWMDIGWPRLKRINRIYLS